MTGRALALWWLAGVVVWGAVSWLVLSPADPAGGGLPIPDKLAHASGWFGLALTAWPAVAGVTRWLRKTRAAVVMGACASWAVATELLQAGIAGRSCDPLDAVADVIGAALGALAWWLYEGRRRDQTTS